MKKHFLILIGYFIIILMILGLCYDSSEMEAEEHRASYNFKITNIDTLPNKRLILHDGNKRIQFHNFYINKRDGIKVGDRLTKKECSRTLIITRQVSNNKFIEVARKHNKSRAAKLGCK
jgi:hypothetical protein